MIAIINYELGNLTSVKNALDKLKIKSVISDNQEQIKKAKAIILPGVGAAGEGIKNLQKKNLDKLIIEEVKKGKPILGICLGMQLLFSTSEEGNVNCLNLIPGKVVRFQTRLKVPHMGWNNLEILSKELGIMNEIKDNSYFYFVHSYYCVPENSSTVLATTNYGINFCSVVNQNNIYGVQFHPEKSGDNGLRLLKNFADKYSC